MSDLKWFKSSFSEASGNACIEVAVHDSERMAIRDSVRPALAFAIDRTAFSLFVNAARAGAVSHVDL
ncbi:hypothetical protein GCM10027073_16770 [Streptomyces chlorus]|uniref:DUF397 domain-containing protein n=1 Tax=Streptomyces chlorus TaxID=887452 RepID=A0ABW1DWY7_9ACTN